MPDDNRAQYAVEAWGTVPLHIVEKYQMAQAYDDETSSYYYLLESTKLGTATAIVNALAEAGEITPVTIRPVIEFVSPYIVIDLTDAPDADKDKVDNVLQHLFATADGNITDAPISDWNQPEANYEGTYIKWSTEDSK